MKAGSTSGKMIANFVLKIKNMEDYGICKIARFQAVLKFPSWTRVWQKQINLDQIKVHVSYI